VICSECGSYQPDRAKFCGVCGSALSQDGLVESFLKKEGGGDIVLPRHRSPWFYLVVTSVVILTLAVLSGIGYVVYRLTWGEGKGEREESVVEDNTLVYSNTDIGFSLSYPDNWTIEEGYPAENELMSLKISFSSQKNLEIRAYQLDPIVTIGGIEGIREYIAEEATQRIRSLGGTPAGGATSGTTGGQTGYTPGTSSSGSTSQGNPTGQETEAEPNGSSGDTLTSSHIGSLPTFYAEFNTNIMGEETRFFIYYIVADDYLFVLQGRAPAAEYKNIRPQFMAIAGSFKWEHSEEAPSLVTPAINAR
jgi:hypothetical protein